MTPETGAEELHCKLLLGVEVTDAIRAFLAAGSRGGVTEAVVSGAVFSGLLSKTSHNMVKGEEVG